VANRPGTQRYLIFDLDQSASMLNYGKSIVEIFSIFWRQFSKLFSLNVEGLINVFSLGCFEFQSLWTATYAYYLMDDNVKEMILQILQFLTYPTITYCSIQNLKVQIIQMQQFCWMENNFLAVSNCFHVAWSVSVILIPGGSIHSLDLVNLNWLYSWNEEPNM